MASTMKAFSKDLNIDDSLSTDGVDSELSLAEDDLLDVFSGTLAFGEQHRNISLNFGRPIYIFCSNKGTCSSCAYIVNLFLDLSLTDILIIMI